MASLLVGGLGLNHSSSAKCRYQSMLIWVFTNVHECSGCPKVSKLSSRPKAEPRCFANPWVFHSSKIHKFCWDCFLLKHQETSFLNQIELIIKNVTSKSRICSPTALSSWRIAVFPTWSRRSRWSQWSRVLILYHFAMLLISSWQLISKCCTPVQPPRTRISVELEILTAFRLSKDVYS